MISSAVINCHACIIFIVTLKHLLHCLEVDNSVTGDPLVDCGPDSVGITFNFDEPFIGSLFIKSDHGKEGCRIVGEGRRNASLTLAFDTECAMQRVRSLEPRGMFVSFNVILTFHPTFVSKADKSYFLKCFYMEAMKVTETMLEVSMLTTSFQTQALPMPVCQYEILDGKSGEIVKYAIVGQPVYHKWTCKTDTTDVFCMRIHSCYVGDGQEENVHLLDKEGCEFDRTLLRQLEYIGDLEAGQEAHVFKFADYPQLYFNCQVNITVREPDEPCPRPKCDSNLQKISQGRKRSIPEASAHIGNITKYGPPKVLSIEQNTLDFGNDGENVVDDSVCLSHAGFGFVISFGLLLFVMLLILVNLVAGEVKMLHRHCNSDIAM